MDRISFKRLYLIYAAILAVLALAALVYVRSLLQDYEDAQPEKRVWDAAETLAADAAAGRFWEKYDLPQAVLGPYEQEQDFAAAYPALFMEDNLTVSAKSGQHSEDELIYLLSSGSFPLAEVQLQAVGPAVTKLAIFSMREWTVAHITPLLEPRDYTLTLPSEAFTVALNSIPLTPDKTGTYTVSGLYLKPDFAIADPSGALADYTLKDGKVLPEVYSYNLTLPAALTVAVDGTAQPGQLLEQDMVHYAIASIKKPMVTISDPYGGSVEYEGGNTLPLTYMTVTAPEGFAVSVQGQPAAPDSSALPADYTHFAAFVPDLPESQVYHIAILQENAEVTATDPTGAVTILPPEEHVYDLTARTGGADQVPAELGVDVLDIAQKWSLFMSNDLAFSKVSPYLIRDSYQYQVAYRYAHGIDITFTSRHTLADPTFTDVSVTNFQQITDTCFSVDIHFVKHMRLASGMAVDDTMNDRFFFVYCDDTDDSKDNPAWKIGGMKEIVDDRQA